ncbi:MAG: DinB family protein, partial [bacterium]|nr:DinB family protein [bacterium]
YLLLTGENFNVIIFFMEDIRTIFVDMIDDAFSGPAFNGNSLLDTIKSLSLEEAVAKDKDIEKSPWELVLHIAYWKYDIVRRLNPYEPRFPWDQIGWPLLPASLTEMEWKRTIKYLDSINRKLRGIITGFQLNKLNDVIDIWNMSYKKVFTFISSHDVYHTAQIRNMGILKN